MINITCGDCGKSFDGIKAVEGDYCICPHCKALIGEAE